MSARAVWLCCAAVAALGCEGTPLVAVEVRTAAGLPPVSTLARLRMIARVCGKNELALAENLRLDGAGSEIEAPIVPGEVFYVWLQGWEPCNPPCVPETPQSMDEQACICVDDGSSAPNQIFRYEGCTGWTLAAEDTVIPITIAEIRPEDRLCPPAARPPCPGG